MKNFSEDLKKVFLAGIGAAAITAEKGKEMIDAFVEKGEITLEQGKALNEELKRNVSETIHKSPCGAQEKDSLFRQLEAMSPEELDMVKQKLAEMEKQKNGENDSAEE